MHKILQTTGLLLLFLTAACFAQHRGDRFFYQGVDMSNDEGTRSLAMGGAYSAVTGDVNAIFYNPAGLADIKTISLTYYGDRSFKLWREAQQYRPTTWLGSLSLYLEGLITPLHNEKYDDVDSLYDFNIYRDSNYVVNNPKMGKDPFSKEAADWQRSRTAYKPFNLALAIPLHDYVPGLVLGLSFNQNKVLDFDRNDTYLTPHPGYTFYNPLVQANGFTVVDMMWYRYNRVREGTLSTLRFAASYQVNENVQVGIGAKYVTGKTDDNLGLNEYGFIHIATQNKFYFKHESNVDSTFGTSNYKSLTATFGLILSYSKFNLGLNINLPYTFTRDWNYTRAQYVAVDVDSFKMTSSAGSDKLKMPVSYTLGINYQAGKKVTMAADIEVIPYGNANYDLAQPDTFFQGWVNQTILRVGLEYRPFKMLSLSVGYRNIPTSYVPDGAAIHDKGSVANSYTVGAGLNLSVGRIDFVYEFRSLKYYDSYYSNTNYDTELSDRFTLGYTYNF